jgi:hypothetical protein
MAVRVFEEDLIAHAKARNAVRVTLQDVENSIAHERYFTAAEGAYGRAITSNEYRKQIPAALNYLTFCVLVMKNGFTVTGESACADPRSFDHNIGQEIARKNAIGKIWMLLGFQLRTKMFDEEQRLEQMAFQPSGDMVTYVGTKVVNARPMNRQAYNDLRGWKLPDDEDGSDEGYLVEYTDRKEVPPLVQGFKGYISWSPKEVFENAYEPVAGERNVYQESLL